MEAKKKKKDDSEKELRYSLELNKDILEYMKRKDDLSVITPENIAKDMIDLVWDNIKDKVNPSWKFLDIWCKSAVFLRKLYSLLYWNDCWYESDRLESMNDEDKEELHGLRLSDDKTRREWIYKHMLYGICPKEDLWAISNFELYRGNVGKYSNLKHLVERDNKGQFKQIFTYEQVLARQFKNMRFNVVVGNPPYNDGMDLDFVRSAYENCTDYACMITPAKWQTAESNQKIFSNISYGEFRRKIVPHMSHVCFYPDCRDIFDATIHDGITWFIVNKKGNNNGVCTVENKCQRQKLLNGSLNRSIGNQSCLCNIVYEVANYIGLDGTNGLKIEELNKNGKYKLWSGKYAEYGEVVEGTGGKVKRNFFSDGTTPATQLCTISESNNAPYTTYKLIYSSDNRIEVEAVKSFLDSKFVRFMLFFQVSTYSNVMNNNTFRYVPDLVNNLKLDHIYTDDELYHYYGLDRPKAKTRDGIKYIDIINAVIKERK